MKHFFISLLYCLTFFLVPLTTHSQWTRCKGPYSGLDIKNFTTDGIRVYIGGVNNLLYYSTDKGNSWIDVTNALNTYKTTSLLLHKNYLYEGTADDGLFRSSDFGKNWEYIGYKGYEIDKLCKYQNTVIATISNVGILISSDNGASWEQIPDNLPGRTNGNIQTNTNSIFADDGTDLFRSKDIGKKWEKMNVSDGSESFDFVTRFIVNGNNIIAEYISGTYYSSNSGDSWKKIGAKDFLPTDITFTYVEHENIYRGLGKGIQKTNTNSLRWTSVSDNIGYITPISLQKEYDTWYLIAKEGLFISIANDTSWSLSGIPSLFVSKTISFKNKLFAATNAGLFSSTDSGKTWEQCNGLAHSVFDLIISDTSLYAASIGGVFEIVEGFPYFEKPIMTGAEVYGLAIQSSTLYITGRNYVQSTTNKGETWNLIAQTPMNILKLEAGKNAIFLSVNNNSTYRSTDGGKDWQPLTLKDNISDFEIVGEEVYAASNSGVYKSSDNGLSWASIANGISENKYSILTSDIDGSIYAGTLEGVFITKDKGDTWHKLGEYFPYYKTNMYIENSTLYVGARNQGLWKYELNMSTAHHNVNTEEEQIRIYCDSKNDVLNIETNTGSNMNENLGMVCDVISIDGRVIFSTNLSSGVTSIPLTGFNIGAYIVSIHSEKQSHRSLIHIIR